MISIAQAVETIMKQKPVYLDLLHSGVVNYSALGRQIRAQVEAITMKEVTNEAVMMALKRMQKPQIVPLQKLFTRTPDITVRSNLVEVTVTHAVEAVIQKELGMRMFAEQGRVFIVTRSMFETTYILHVDMLEALQPYISGNSTVFTGLSAISIHLPEETVTTRGVYYQLLQALAWEGVNVMEVASTYREFTILVQNEDVDTAFRVLKMRVQQ